MESGDHSGSVVSWLPPKTPKLFPVIPAKIEIQWVDAASDNGWQLLSEFTVESTPLNQCFTTGYLLEINDQEVRIVQTISPIAGTGTEAMYIPRGCIIDIKMIDPWRYIKSDAKQEEQ
jgi:hypothetical protein